MGIYGHSRETKIMPLEQAGVVARRKKSGAMQYCGGRCRYWCMMKRNIAVAALSVLVLTAAACGAKTQEFSAQDGSVKAVLKSSGQWKITNGQGQEPVADYDSMRVVEVGEDGHPMTVIYYKGSEQHVRQYYTTMQVRCEGQMVDGLREGRWVFYHPNGNVQSECTYVQGHEEGPYRVYREDGKPYYLGHYKEGKPVGTWEFYDGDGNLAGTKVY